VNRWMNDPQYLAQIGHFFGGYALMVTTIFVCTALGTGLTPIVVVLGLWIAYGLGKEFWYDMRYELPRQTWKDSGQDFAFLVLGAVVGLGTGFGIRCLGSGT